VGSLHQSRKENLESYTIFFFPFSYHP